MGETSKRERVLIILGVVTLPEVVHGGQSLVLNSVVLLSKEIPDPPQ